MRFALGSKAVEVPRNEDKPMRQLFPRRYDILVVLLASGVLLGVGLSLPVLTVKRRLLFWEDGSSFSVLSGIWSLLHEGHYFLGGVIFFFSVVFPFIKLLSLMWLWFVRGRAERRQRVLGWLGTMGKWSMLDVFVAALIVVVAKLGGLASAKPELGVYVFAAAILLSLIGTFQMESLGRKTE